MNQVNTKFSSIDSVVNETGANPIKEIESDKKNMFVDGLLPHFPSIIAML